MRRIVAMAFTVMCAAAFLAPAPAAAQVVGNCPDWKTYGGPLRPGDCWSSAFEIADPTFDVTFFVSGIASSLLVYDENNNPVSGADRATVLSYYTMTIKRYPFLDAADPTDALPGPRTGGIDVLVEPVASAIDGCSDLPVTSPQSCKVGIVRATGSSALSGQATDSRIVVVEVYLDGAPPNNMFMASDRPAFNVSPTLPQSDCPGPELYNVCTVPVYER